MDNVLKYRLIERIIQIEDDKVLNEIRSLLGLAETDFWDDLPNEVKENIGEAKDELVKGERIPHQDVMAEVRKRYLKK